MMAESNFKIADEIASGPFDLLRAATVAEVIAERRLSTIGSLQKSLQKALKRAELAEARLERADRVVADWWAGHTGTNAMLGFIRRLERAIHWEPEENV